MRSVLFSTIILLVLGLAITGCRMRPVYNVESAAMPTSPSTMIDDVTNAIIRAGATRGWNMKILNPGQIEATTNVRGKHIAVVIISYNTREFSINYKDSHNLNYDGKNIHSNYYGWIKKLETEILKETGKI